MKTEREMFEEWVKSWPSFSERTLARDGRHPDYYGNPVIQGAWEAWQARAVPATTVQCPICHGIKYVARVSGNETCWGCDGSGVMPVAKVKDDE